jgi:DNA polymerase I-like protein with 3'-5' exonuclease and polymerase domains
MEGSNLHLLTPTELKEYATADAVTTLKLFTFTTEYFDRIGYDYRLDHNLYVPVARGVADARSRGIRVNREAVKAALTEIQIEINEIRETFLTRFKTEIAQIETDNQAVGLAGYKTQKGKDAYLTRKEWGFNVGSTAQLTRLFVGILGIKPTFWTEPGKAHKDKIKRGEQVDFTPKPSFKAAHLETYGEGGKLLINYKKKGLVERQLKSLLELSEKDGSYHLTLKAVGTATGRLSGGN